MSFVFYFRVFLYVVGVLKWLIYCVIVSLVGNDCRRVSWIEVCVKVLGDLGFGGGLLFLYSWLLL